MKQRARRPNNAVGLCVPEHRLTAPRVRAPESPALAAWNRSAPGMRSAGEAARVERRGRNQHGSLVARVECRAVHQTCCCNEPNLICGNCVIRSSVWQKMPLVAMGTLATPFRAYRRCSRSSSRSGVDKTCVVQIFFFFSLCGLVFAISFNRRLSRCTR